MSKMNIAERRLPQDGRIRLKVGEREIDLRVSTIPVLYGESVVMRILRKEGIVIDLDALGFPPHTLAIFNQIINKPNGIFLVTGPTGSGKSTTLASIINQINLERAEHIITIEDPIEYLHPHKNCLVNQREVGADTKSFKLALKYILRQDPDTVLIGDLLKQYGSKYPMFKQVFSAVDADGLHPVGGFDWDGTTDNLVDRCTREIRHMPALCRMIRENQAFILAPAPGC